jgi:hypothetical protein
MASQNIAELQQLKKFVKKVDPSKMRQARMITGDLKVSRRSSHSEPYLTKSEVRLRVAKMLKIQINRGSEALLEPKNAPDPGDTKPNTPAKQLCLFKGILSVRNGLSPFRSHATA